MPVNLIKHEAGVITITSSEISVYQVQAFVNLLAHTEPGRTEAMLRSMATTWQLHTPTSDITPQSLEVIHELIAFAALISQES